MNKYLFVSSLSLFIFFVFVNFAYSAENKSFYRYETQEGIVSFTDKLEKIPSRYQSHAAKISWTDQAEKVNSRMTPASLHGLLLPIDAKSSTSFSEIDTNHSSIVDGKTVDYLIMTQEGRWTDINGFNTYSVWTIIRDREGNLVRENSVLSPFFPEYRYSR